MDKPKYPDVEVQLSGQDGNAFFIVGRVARALRKAGVSEKEIDKFRTEAKSGDYSNLLSACGKWVEVC